MKTYTKTYEIKSPIYKEIDNNTSDKNYRVSFVNTEDNTEMVVFDFTTLDIFLLKDGRVIEDDCIPYKDNRIFPLYSIFSALYGILKEYGVNSYTITDKLTRFKNKIKESILNDTTKRLFAKFSEFRFEGKLQIKVTEYNEFTNNNPYSTDMEYNVQLDIILTIDSYLASKESVLTVLINTNTNTAVLYRIN